MADGSLASRVDALLGPAPAWEANPAAYIGGAVGVPVRLTSEHRDPAHNAAVGGAPHSDHLGYAAFDFVPHGMSTAAACRALIKSGVPFNKVIDEGSHVHVSFGGDKREVIGHDGHGVIGYGAPAQPKSVHERIEAILDASDPSRAATKARIDAFLDGKGPLTPEKPKAAPKPTAAKHDAKPGQHMDLVEFSRRAVGSLAGGVAEGGSAVLRGFDDVAMKTAAKMFPGALTGDLVDPKTGAIRRLSPKERIEAAAHAGFKPDVLFQGVADALDRHAKGWAPKDKTWFEDLLHTAGGFGTALAGGVAGVEGLATVFGLQAFDQAYTEAKSKGASDVVASRAAAEAMIAQAGVAVAPWAEGVNSLMIKYGPKAVRPLLQAGQRTVAAYLARAGVRAAGDAAFGGSAQLAENVVAKANYDPRRNLGQGVAEGAAGMVVAGRVMEGAHGAARKAYDAYRARRLPKAPAPKEAPAAKAKTPGKGKPEAKPDPLKADKPKTFDEQVKAAQAAAEQPKGPLVDEMIAAGADAAGAPIVGHEPEAQRPPDAIKAAHIREFQGLSDYLARYGLGDLPRKLRDDEARGAYNGPRLEGPAKTTRDYMLRMALEGDGYGLVQAVRDHHLGSPDLVRDPDISARESQALAEYGLDLLDEMAKPAAAQALAGAMGAPQDDKREEGQDGPSQEFADAIAGLINKNRPPEELAFMKELDETGKGTTPNGDVYHFPPGVDVKPGPVRDFMIDEMTNQAFGHSDEALAAPPAAEPAKLEAPAPPAAEPAKSDWGASNTIFTADAYADAVAKLKDKLRFNPNQLNSGFDPEIGLLGLQVAGFHIEAGARTFADFAAKMVETLGESVKPYLSGWYEAVRRHPGFDASGMTPTAESDAMHAQMLKPADSADDPKGLTGIATQVADALSEGPITSTDLQNMAGDTLASGAIARDDLYDAAEHGMNLYLIRHPDEFTPAVGEDAAVAIAKRIEGLKNRLPTQTVRAGEKEAFQQFSTPPDYSYAATWAADLQGDDVVLEPSAGTGSFVAHALNAKVRDVHANDLSDRRAGILKQLGAKVTGENAEHLHAILPADVRPTVVLMNPPFSSSGSRGIKDNQIGGQHVIEALRRLEPGGRLIAIVGGGMTPDAASYKDFFRTVGRDHEILANLGVDGDIYRKYGTTFPTRLLVIDKVAPSGREPKTTEGLKTAADIIAALREIRDERASRTEGQHDATGAGGPALAPGGQGGGRPGPSLPDATGVLGDGAGADGAGGSGGAHTPPPKLGGRPGGGGGVAPGRPGPRGGGNAPGVAPGSNGPDGGGDLGAGDGVRPDGSGQRDEPGLTPPPIAVEAAEASLDPNVHDAPLSDAVYETYKPQRVSFKGAKEHPGALAQSAAMASVEPPEVARPLKLPREIIEKGLLSDAQLESIAYAGAAHDQRLPAPEGETGPRRGFFIGDGTGVGKGREVAGVMLDNMGHGRKKHVWVSESQALINDARRDWSGLNQDPGAIFEHSGVKPSDPIKAKNGILFTTYNTLRAGAKAAPAADGAAPAAKPKTRLDQLVEWLGEDFDGVIAFDEAHNLGNAVGAPGGRGGKSASQKALAGVDLQKRLPNARVLYVSATGATEIDNLAYADRLGLWGRGTAFADRAHFMQQVAGGGIAALELVSRDMKAMGLYLARSLSYDGVEYDRVEHPLTEDQRAIYDELAGAWQIALQDIDAAMAQSGITDASGATNNAQAKSAILSQFWGAHQRFFNQVITSMQMPTVLKGVEKDIAEGRQAVLQLVNTNEAAQERALAKITADNPEALDDLDMTPRDQLMQMVQSAFPVQRQETYLDDNGNVRSRPATTKDGAPIEDPDLVRKREELLDRLGAVRVPDGPLEMLLNHFGPEAISEVTGRKQRVVKAVDAKTGERKTVVEKRGGQANIAETDAFQGGRKKILVFSEAGGTGRSYHADLSSGSAGARRSHYLVQGGWRADKAVQGFGRTHRTNQASAPLFHLVTTDLQGQKRFISSIARRLSQLGALTKGERRTGDQGLFGLRDNLESAEARAALQDFYRDAASGRIEGVGMDVLQDQMGLKLVDPNTGALFQNLPPITSFLNRLLSLKVDLQNAVFDALSQRIDQTLERAAAAGTLDVGLETLRADAITKKAEAVVHTHPESGAETRHVHLEVKNRNHPRSYEETAALLRKVNSDKTVRFVRSLRSGKVFGVQDATAKTDANGRIVDQKRLLDTTGYQYLDEYRLHDRQFWQDIDEADAPEAWAKAVADTPEFSQHDLHLITGAILPIWDRLKGHPSIYRLQTDAGERLLGRVIPANSVADTLARLGVDRAKVTAKPAEVVDQVMTGGKIATLANGWKIKRSLVAGERRLELTGPTVNHMRGLAADGVFTERISWETRFFIPVGAESARVVDRVVGQHPVVSLESAGGDADLQRKTDAPAGPADDLAPIGHGLAGVEASPSALVDEVRAVVARLAPGAEFRPMGELATKDHPLSPDGERVGGATWREDGKVVVAVAMGEDAAGSARHEIIHALRRMGAFTDQEWAALAGHSAAAGWAVKYGAEALYKKGGARLTVEEAIAEGWRHGREERWADQPAWVRTIFERIEAMLHQVARHVRRLMGEDATARDVMDMIESGEIGARKSGGLEAGETWASLQRRRAEGAGEGDAPAPGHEPGPIVGRETDAVERTGAALFRLGGHDVAGKLEALKHIESLAPEARDPAAQAELQDAIEQRLIDPKAQIPEHLAAAAKAWAEPAGRLAEEYKKLKARQDPIAAMEIDGLTPGHVPRRAVGHSPLWDAGTEGPEGGRDPILPGSRLASKAASSQHQRSAGWIVTDADGAEHFTQVKPTADSVDAMLRPIAKSRQATMAEIEANTETRYHRNALVNTWDEALRLARVNRNLEVLDSLKGSLKAKGLAHQDSWKRPAMTIDAEGNTATAFVAQNAKTRRPDGFVPIHHIPALEGWSFEPQIAEVLEDFYPSKHDDLDTTLARLNRALTASMFITPIPHALNVAAHAWVARGADWFDPRAYPRMARVAPQAVREVLTMGPKYRQLLREGNGLLYGHTQVRNFYQLFMRQAGMDLVGEPQNWAAFADAFSLQDLGIRTAKDFVKLWYRSSNKAMWAASDIMMMGRVLELEAKGLSTREAIDNAEKDIPAYKIPSRILGNRALAQALRRNGLIVFGAYTYGRWKAMAETTRWTWPGQTLAQRVESFGTFAAMIAGFALLNEGDKVLEAVTGDPDARLPRPGPFRFAQALTDVGRGKASPGTMASAVAGESPALNLIQTILTNRDYFGREAFHPHDAESAVAEMVDMMSGSLYPLSMGLEMFSPGGPLRVAGRLAGADIPPSGTRAKRAHYVAKDAHMKARQDAKNPVYKAIKSAEHILGGDS